MNSVLNFLSGLSIVDFVSILIVGGFIVSVVFCIGKHKEENERLDTFLDNRRGTQ